MLGSRVKEQAMIRPKKPPLISTTQFAAIVVLTIALFLVIDFGRRTTAGYYVSQTEKRLVAEIEALLKEQEILKQRRDYVQTDAYVEQWAREQAHMVRPGDRRLIVVTPPASTAPADDQPAPAFTTLESAVAREPVPNWHLWWRLFWDTEPGTLQR
jgi:cell division protein FtsB